MHAPLSTRRVGDFSRVLFPSDSAAVDLAQLSTLCFGGIPDGVRGLRPICWRLLAGSLPADRRRWASAAAAGRLAYADLVHSLWEGQADAGPEVAQVRADVARTQPDIALFRQRVQQVQAQAPGRHACALAQRIHQALGSGAAPAALGSGAAWTHADAMARVLVVYARLNRGSGYAQGMNDVLAPLYYACAADAGGDAEAAAFHLLVRVLRGAHLDLFVAAMDDDGAGLRGALRRWWACVQAADAALWARLRRCGVRPEHFALRWLLVCGAREFALPDVLALWDALLANAARIACASAAAAGPAGALAAAAEAPAAVLGRAPGAVHVHARFGASGDGGERAQLGFLGDFFAAVLVALRPRLLRASFDEALALLQNLRASAVPELQDMRALVAQAVRLRRRRCAARAEAACRAVAGAGLACALPLQQLSCAAVLRRLAPALFAPDVLCAVPEPRGVLAVYRCAAGERPLLLGRCGAAGLVAAAGAEGDKCSLARDLSEKPAAASAGGAARRPWWMDAALPPPPPPQRWQSPGRRRFELVDHDSD
ncbi:hypothetical protein LPJ66_002696 [Kickxella alabastrina]|uniref:Uncharacterized protein n=1 Tax=Kickxella alabastrina TaxID=61397 RepID=A0ACC1IPQ6_9FUNG|nr:hypothetical protein LPJ66_002696 [Kickxella alabastrina]